MNNFIYKHNRCAIFGDMTDAGNFDSCISIRGLVKHINYTLSNSKHKSNIYLLYLIFF